ncbi:tetratricopeptide repeat protein [Gimesia panareensis]|uniref:Tetratricopeptide repeat protein n=1 Tax=Gimesia panareensis TaxID=2527978 RepID=A0A517Q2A2_9PLAN|nr:tetratricopeptide repeat protein [Gimesia panareensis]QDT25682.1 Tetratricopeptide repeat protein [Gimesia panareensis]QDU48627.1 Tetratricopeptide repeat protein [Gimesia panareensis]
MGTIQSELDRGIALCEAVWRDMSLYEKNYLEAIECFHKVLNLDPLNTDALINLGAALSDLGNHQEALKYYHRAEEAGSVDRNLFYNIGVAMMNIDQFTRQEAPKYFQLAADKEPSKKTREAYFDPQAH